MKIPRRSLGTVTATSPTVSAIASAIYRQEGAVQNNNPGNLRYVGQAGATGADSRGFAVFPTLTAGQAAENAQIALDINRGTCASGAPVSTLADLISCLSPSSENDTSTYISNVSQWTGIAPSTALADYDGTGQGNALTLPADFSGSTTDSGFDLSGLSFDSIDFSDPTTIALTLCAAAALMVFLGRR